MKQKKQQQSVTVPSDAQVKLGFDEDLNAEAQHDVGSRRVVFNEPDPKSIFIGNQRLDRYLRDVGLEEILVMGELLGSLECWPSFESAYRPGGRAPYHPRLLVGLILLGLQSGQSSLRQLEQLARADTRAWWLTGGLCPDYSTLSKFIARHSELLTGPFFEELTRQVLKRTGSRGTTLAGDGTVIQAAASSLKLLKQEAADQAATAAQQRADAAPENEKLQRQAAQTREVAETCRERSEERRYKGRANPDAPVSPTEPEAVVQPLKNKTKRASYKPSVVSNTDRIVTGQAVDPSNEPRVVESMVQQAERITGQAVTELQLDAGYFCASVIKLSYERDISLLCAPEKGGPKTSRRGKTAKQFSKHDFVYDEERDAYQCPAGELLRPSRTWKGDARRSARVLYSGACCADCTLRARCIRGKGIRTVTRPEHEELMEAQLAVMKQAGARKHYRKRQGMVEPVFGELKHVQHLTRFRRKGTRAVRLEFALHCAAHNLRRYLTLRARNSPGNRARNRRRGKRSLGLLLIHWVPYQASKMGLSGITVAAYLLPSLDH